MLCESMWRVKIFLNVSDEKILEILQAFWKSTETTTKETNGYNNRSYSIAWW